jgi:glycosyltransferase involved in cell wall biosynthesis
MSLSVSVVIVTRNRCDDLRIALKSVLAQTIAAEVIVLDDASTDKTTEMVRDCFPSVRLERSEHPRGCVVLRNVAAKIARGDVIFSIDDDAEFSSPRVIEQTIMEFSDPRVAAIAIPYIEPRKGNHVFQKAPDANTIWITDSFRGTSHALRRKIFNQVGGYRDQLIHQGEEADLSIRLLRFGWVVRLGGGDEIIHYETPIRDWHRVNFFGRRNDVLFAWHNVPMPRFPFHLAATTVNGFCTVARGQYRSGMMMGMLSGYFDICRRWKEREPVSQEIYRLHRLLKKQGPKSIYEIEQFLPPLGSK